MSENKRRLGQFFTKNTIWYKEHIRLFLEDINPEIIFDPFAGQGDILAIFSEYKTEGMDIDPNLNWIINDSLIDIPRIENGIIVTNPPYLTNYSAKRKGIIKKVELYFTGTNYEDLYQRAIETCLLKNDYLIAIIPETYINSGKLSSRLINITVIEENPFNDTDCPVCVACFGPTKSKEILIYKNNSLLGNLDEINKHRPKYDKSIEIIFNEKTGRIGLRAIDGINQEDKIKFLKRNELEYSEDNIKVSSRLMTFIEIPSLSDEQINSVIIEANTILDALRIYTFDIIFSPFKGNNKANIRRRRLDYKSARAILEQAYKNLYSHSINNI